jgi:hypothetical protein
MKKNREHGESVAQNYVRFQILTVASLNMTAFWDKEPDSLIEVE